MADLAARPERLRAAAVSVGYRFPIAGLRLIAHQRRARLRYPP
jgi:hypothetical protein